MKKKGLIISTVVMVVVLIASLTTATYAWFTTEGSATVTDISFGVVASSDLVIGVSKNNTWVETNDLANAQFVSDGTVFSEPTVQNPRGTWSSTSEGTGLGLTIDTGLQLNGVEQAVYSFNGNDPTDYKRGTGDTYKYKVETGLARSDTVTMKKATGNGSKIDTTSIAQANMNGWTTTGTETTTVKGDYLDVVFGVKAQKDNVKAFGCLITVTNKQTGNVGLSAALHAVYSTDGTTYTEVDLYGNYACGQKISDIKAPAAATKDFGTDTTTTYLYDGQKQTTDGDTTLFIPLAGNDVKDFDTNLGTADSDIKQLHLMVYLCGPDGDCKSGYSASATVTIQFVSINQNSKTKK